MTDPYSRRVLHSHGEPSKDAVTVTVPPVDWKHASLGDAYLVFRPGAHGVLCRQCDRVLDDGPDICEDCAWDIHSQLDGWTPDD